MIEQHFAHDENMILRDEAMKQRELFANSSTITQLLRRYTIKMKQWFVIFTACVLSAAPFTSHGQVVQNRPYTDLRPFHFGVLLGTHVQDVELVNVGEQLIRYSDGTSRLSNVSAEQDRWDAGFHVGVLGELRLSTHFHLRIAPAMYFGTRHLTFRNLTDRDAQGNPREQRQDLKTAYIATQTALLFTAPRVDNHRPYLLAGLNPMVNLSGRNGDFIKLKRYDVFAEVGVGCDFYLPFFKLRPELKFMFSLVNAIDASHIKRVNSDNMLPYTRSADRAHTKMIALTFYFE